MVLRVNDENDEHSRYSARVWGTKASYVTLLLCVPVRTSVVVVFVVFVVVVVFLMRKMYAVARYILSHNAPQVMRRLLPEQRLLLILRNPVDRAYSEWQMKLRRVEAQLCVIGVAVEHACSHTI